MTEKGTVDITIMIIDVATTKEGTMIEVITVTMIVVTTITVATAIAMTTMTDTFNVIETQGAG